MVEYVNLAEAIRVRASNGTGVVSVFPDKGQFDTKGEGVGIVDKAVSDSKGPWIQLSEDRMYVNSDKLSYVIFTGSAIVAAADTITIADHHA